MIKRVSLYPFSITCSKVRERWWGIFNEKIIDLCAGKKSMAQESRHRKERTGQGIACAVILIAGFWLAAWMMTDLPVKWAGRGMITMKTNMALCQMLCGMVLLINDLSLKGPKRTFVLVASVGVFLIGGLTITEHVSKLDFGIDCLLAEEPSGAPATASPNRMGLLGAFSLCLLSLGILSLPAGKLALGSFLGFSVIIINLVPAFGFLFRIPQYYSRIFSTGIAFPTVVGLMLLGLGVILKSKNLGLALKVLSSSPGGALIRGMFPAIVIFPIVLGFFEVYGFRYGLFDSLTGDAISVVSQILLYAFILNRIALKLDRQALLTEKTMGDLRILEEKFSKAFANNPAAITLTRLDDGCFLDVNETWLSLMGYKREEAVGKSARKMKIWPKQEDINRFVKELKNQGALTQWEQEFFKKSGEIFVGQLSSTVLDIRGEKCILTSLIDVTAGRRAEARLRESEERLSFAMEACHIGAWDLDLEDYTVFRSLEHARIFGYDSTQLEWNLVKFFSHVLPEYHEAIKAMISKSTKEKTGWTFEFRIRRVDGAIRWVWVSGRYNVNLTGRQRVMGVIQDITPRKEAEEALKRNERRLGEVNSLLAGIIDNTNDLIAAVDGDFNFIAMNQAYRQECLEIFGFDLKVGENLAERLGHFPEDQKTAVHLFRKALQGKSELVTAEFGDPGKNRRIYELRFSPILGDGVVIGAAQIGRNITERKKYEDLLKSDKEVFEGLVRERTQKLMETQAELERAKRLSDIGVLASTVAHELRNPLAAISMAASNVRRKAKMPEIERHLSTIQKKVIESDQIINNLLFYSRIKPPHLEPVLIHGILNESLEFLKGKQKSGLRIFKETDSIKGLVLMADPVQMREVFNNVFNNANDAVPPGQGEIRILAKREKDFLVIEIQDNGPGIEKELQDKIFDPFFTTKAKGTGLGLSVCRQIIALHYGEIGVEKDFSRGTRIYIRLPLRPHS